MTTKPVFLAHLPPLLAVFARARAFACFVANRVTSLSLSRVLVCGALLAGRHLSALRQKHLKRCARDSTQTISKSICGGRIGVRVMTKRACTSPCILYVTYTHITHIHGCI